MNCEDCVYSDIADWEQNEKKQEKQRRCIGAIDIKSCAMIYRNVNLKMMKKARNKE